VKVVLFCGGFGMRLREYSDLVPKPLVTIGHRPMVWHLMKYYAHFGHKEFILCLGWKGNEIKNYFLNYDECESNDFVMKSGGNDIKLLSSDIDDWSITFVDTGTASCIGSRLVAVRKHVQDEEVFLANYADGLTDLHLPRLIEAFHRNKAVAAFISVRPQQSFHIVHTERSGIVGRRQ
jgi:glucose-1-phosphate cytidylyltransferase